LSSMTLLALRKRGQAHSSPTHHHLSFERTGGGSPSSDKIAKQLANIRASNRAVYGQTEIALQTATLESTRLLKLKHQQYAI
jgi:hypothetical protein